MNNKKEVIWYWITATSLFLVMMFNCGVGYYSISLFVQPVSNFFKITTGDYAIVYTFYGAGSGLAAVILSPYLKRYSLKSMIIVGGLISSAGYFLYSVASNVFCLYIGGILIGASTIFAGTASVQLAIALWFVEKRSMITGFVAAASGIGSAVGSPIIGYLIQTVGWRVAYGIISALVFVFVFVQILFLFHNKPQDIGLEAYGASCITTDDNLSSENDSGLSVKDVRNKPVFAVFIAGMVAIAISYQIITLFQSSILVEGGISVENAAKCLSVFALVDMCSKASAGVISERFGFRVVTIYCSIGCIIAFFIGMRITGLMSAILFSALLGLWPTMIVLYGVTASISLFGKKHLAEFISLTQVTMCTVSLFGMPIVRLIYNTIGDFLGILLLLILIVSAFMLMMLYLLSPIHLYKNELS